MSTSLDETNVFVKYLPSDFDDEGLSNAFSPWGVIKSAKVMVDHQTGSSLGFGFVRFSTPQEAQQAIEKMSGQRIQNKVLLCKLSNCSSNSIAAEPSTNLYIKPLLAETRETDLVELFSKFGPIAAAKVMVDKATGESKQIGFVRFEELEHATAAMHEMNGYKISEDHPALIVKYAETESQRVVRKSRQVPPPSTSPSPPSSPRSYYYPQQAPSSPPSPPMSPVSFYYPPQVPLYVPSVSYYYPQVLPYYVTMAPSYSTSYSPPQTPSSPIWRPSYVLAAEQASGVV